MDKNFKKELMEKLSPKEAKHMEILGVRQVNRKKLYEEGRRLSYKEAFFILISITLSYGYIQISSFYINNPSFYIIPILTCILNAVFGYISIYMLIDARSLQDRLGSFQEMAFYFTEDRALIMVIGFQYGLFCLMLCSYCINNIVTFFSTELI